MKKVEFHILTNLRLRSVNFIERPSYLKKLHPGSKRNFGRNERSEFPVLPNGNMKIGNLNMKT